MFKPQKRHLFLTHLVFENLWDNHRHIVLGPSLKGRRDEHKVLARQNTFILLFLSLSLWIMKTSFAYLDAQAQTAIRLSSQYNSSVL